MKIYGKSHERALELKRESDRVYKEHKDFLTRAEKMEKNAKTPTEKKVFKKVFRETDRAFNKKENEADKKYYNHIHNNFDLEKVKTRYTDKKYKEHFCDEKYINDLYKEKAKEQAKAKKKIGKKSTKSVVKKSTKGKKQCKR